MPNNLPVKPHEGLIMVKPHAVEQVLDPVIGAVLGGSDGLGLLSPSDPLSSMIKDIELRAPVIRDLRIMDYGESLLTLFYDDKSDRRYYPMIREKYLGKVVFLPFFFHGSDEKYNELLSAIKGTAETYGATGSVVTEAIGIRGALGQPYQFFTNEEASDLDDASYRQYFEPVVDNYIHVCDSTQEVEIALKTIFK